MSTKESNKMNYIMVILFVIIAIISFAYFMLTMSVIIDQPTTNEYKSLADIHNTASLYFNILICILLIFVCGFFAKLAIEDIAETNVYNQRFHN